jgi:hypothetical protein
VEGEREQRQALMTLFKTFGVACIECGDIDENMMDRGDGTKICAQCIALQVADEGERSGNISKEMADEIRRRVEMHRRGEDVPPWDYGNISNTRT